MRELDGNAELCVVERIEDIVEYFDLDEPESIILEDQGVKRLVKAINAGDVKIDKAEERLIVDLHKPVKLMKQQEGETTEVAFRSAVGSDRLLLQNGKDSERGSNVKKVICRLCDLSHKSYDTLPSQKISILEGVFTLFL